jgi:hypothetical protein
MFFIVTKRRRSMVSIEETSTLTLSPDLDLRAFRLEHVLLRDEGLDALAELHEHAVVDHAQDRASSMTRPGGTR